MLVQSSLRFACLVLIVAGLGINGIFAQVTGSTTAAIIIERALTVSWSTDPSWSDVTVPRENAAEFTLDFMSGSAGVFMLTGIPNSPVSFSVEFEDLSEVGIFVKTACINGHESNGTGLLSDTGSLPLRIGGVMSVNAGADAKKTMGTVTVNIDYN